MEIPVDWAVPQVVAFLLVVARLSGLFLIAPVFSSSMIPMQIKMFALLGLAVTITPIVAPDPSAVPLDGVELAVTMLKEVLIGLAMGFGVAIVFTAVQVAASFVDVSMGLSMASIIDPVNNVQATVLGSFYSMVATLAFLAVNGHHFLLAGVFRSFEVVGVTEQPNLGAMLENLDTVFVGLFAMAFQIAAPILVTLLLVDVVLGIVSRVVPQMNVFFVGIPLKLGVGMMAIIICMPTFVGFFEQRVSDVVDGASVLAGAGPDRPAPSRDATSEAVARG